jgi:hypothetical protein
MLMILKIKLSAATKDKRKISLQDKSVSYDKNTKIGLIRSLNQKIDSVNSKHLNKKITNVF